MLISRFFLIVAIILVAAPSTHAQSDALPLDMQGAIEWCESRSLDRIEGVWSYPQDGVSVLIHKSSKSEATYDINIVESEKLSLLPGELLGTISATTAPDKFSMKLFTSKTNNKLLRPRECSLALTADDCGLIVKSKTRHWQINPMGLLPYFWKIARMKESDPTKNLPIGMIRLYPSYDGNGSSRYHIRYL